MSVFDLSSGDPRIGLTALVGATALAMAVSGPQVNDSSAGVLAGGPAAMVEQVTQWRPQAPPPWGEADHSTMDEVDDRPVGSPDLADRDNRGGGELRSRPER